MTSGAQPPRSGAPTPVQGVTGGPPVLGGQISNDPNTGNVVVAPNPGQVLQVRKGNNPTALQVYEYFHTNTDYARLSLNSQTNGPFQLAVETAPSSVIRDLDILANGHITLNAGGAINIIAGATSNIGISGTLSMSVTGGTVLNTPNINLPSTFQINYTNNGWALGFNGAGNPLIAASAGSILAPGGAHVSDIVCIINGASYRIQLWQ